MKIIRAAKLRKYINHGISLNQIVTMFFKCADLYLSKPHFALSKEEGFKKSEVKVLSFGEDLGEASCLLYFI